MNRNRHNQGNEDRRPDFPPQPSQEQAKDKEDTNQETQQIRCQNVKYKTGQDETEIGNQPWGTDPLSQRNDRNRFLFYKSSNSKQNSENKHSTGDQTGEETRANVLPLNRGEMPRHAKHDERKTDKHYS